MPAKIYHYDLYGKREDKYEFLRNNSVSTTPWTELQPDPKYHFFVPKDFAEQEEWEKGVKVSELFEVFNSGIETQKDSITIHFEKESLEKIKRDFYELETKQILDKYKITESRDWKVDLARLDLQDTQTLKINYRPFDYRWTEYSGKSKGFMAYPRHDTSKHFLQANLGLIVPRQNNSDFKHAFVTNTIVDGNITSSSRLLGAGRLFPLYLYPDVEKGEGIFEDTPMTVSSPLERGTLSNVGVLNNGDQDGDMGLHNGDVGVLNNGDQGVLNNGDRGVSSTVGRVWINDTQYFENVPEIAWNSYIGGYQPAQKWLKDRKGRELSFDDIMHYQKIICILQTTYNLSLSIDAV